MVVPKIAMPNSSDAAELTIKVVRGNMSNLVCSGSVKKAS